jgi:ADP-heptose:LPS heptosyltransferase
MDNLGDVLLAGPAVRAAAAQADSVTLLAVPRGRAAAELLPGVDEVIEWCAPWIDPEPEPITSESLTALRFRRRAGGFDRAFILTSFHQSPLPLALLLRDAGVPWIGAISADYPGSLLDLRHYVPGDPPEAERALSLMRAAGFTRTCPVPGHPCLNDVAPHDVVDAVEHLLLYAPKWPAADLVATFEPTGGGA